MKYLFSSLLLIGLGGCSSIGIEHLDATQKPAKGEPWNLAMTQYRVTITRELTSCEGKLDGKVTVSATVGKTLDEQQQYALYANPVWATSDITSTLAPDGTNTGLNAHAEDQTAQVIGNVVTFAADVAKLAAAAAVPVDHPWVLGCTRKVSEALAVMYPKGSPALQDRIGTETDALNAVTARVSLLTTQAQNDPSYKKALNVALGEQAAAQAALAADQKRLTSALKTVSYTQQVVWPNKGNEFALAAPFAISPDILAKWVEYTGGTGAVPALPSAPIFDVFLSIYAADGAGGWMAPGSPGSGDTSIGVPVRLPRTGRLLVCSAAPCPLALPPGWMPGPQQTLAIQPDQAILQLGRIYNIPLRGGIFRSEGAVIAIDANGLPTSIQVTEKVAAAAAATSALASAATQASAIPAQIAQSRLAATQAETSQLQAQSALAAAQAASASANQLGAIQAQTTLISAQNALDAAHAASVKAQAAAAP
jgi:hypothetical protein